MRALILFLLICLSTLVLPIACLDQLDLTVHGTVNVVVVDGLLQ